MKKPFNCITVAEAKELQDNWMKTRALYIEKELGAPDCCEFLFSVEELQAFLDYVKAGSGNQTPGIRIYFGAYGTGKRDKATVFLAPTLGVTVGSENNYKLEPINRSLQGMPPKIY